MMNSRTSVKWKYLAMVIACSVFLYFFTNYSVLRPSPFTIHTKEYGIGILLMIVCFLNAFVLHPTFYKQNRTTAYAVWTIISLLLAIITEFSWLYSDIMDCLLDTLTPKDAHSYYWVCMGFASLRDAGLISFTFLLCEFFRNKANEKNTETLLLKSDDKLLVKDLENNSILLNYKTIRYCVQEQNVTKIYGKENDVYFRYGSLKYLKDLFGNEYFIQINRNTLVATRLIKKYSEGQLWLLNESSPFEVSPAFQEQKGLRIPIPKSETSSDNEGDPTSGKAPILEKKRIADIFLLIKENPKISAVKISERIHVSQSTVNRILAQLKAEGLIEYVGSKKTGGYHTLPANNEQCIMHNV